MFKHLKTLYRYRELLWTWSVREVRIRYKQSVLGVAWAILQPTLLMLVLTVVFSAFARLPSDGTPYAVFCFLALLPWMFVANALTFGSTSLINNINLVTRIYFPREVLPLGHLAAALVDFGVACVPLTGLLLYYGIPFWRNAWWLVLLVPIQIVFTAGLTLPAAALMVAFRDLRFVVPLGLQAWMFASPVVYPISLVPERYRTLYSLNPMAGLIDAYRRALLGGESPAWSTVGWLVLVSVGCFWLGYNYFKRAERQFADRI